MTVKELKEKLNQYPDDFEIIITDGIDCKSYRGEFITKVFDDGNGNVSVNIGIGGLQFSAENEASMTLGDYVALYNRL